MGKTLFNMVLSLGLGSLGGGCTYTRSITQTNIPQDRRRPIKAVEEKLIFFSFNFDNDQVFKLTGKLTQKCPKGAVQGVLTKDLVTNYFMFFVWAQVTRVEAFCVETSKNLAEVDSLTDELGRDSLL